MFLPSQTQDKVLIGNVKSQLLFSHLPLLFFSTMMLLNHSFPNYLIDNCTCDCPIHSCQNGKRRQVYHYNKITQKEILVINEMEPMASIYIEKRDWSNIA
ncbi:hypothetical protein ACOSQ2_015111 [Xanthoceras sorbifolium]